MVDSHAPEETPNDRQLLRSMLRGLRGRCPNCGIGTIFSGVLAIRPVCPYCGEALHHYRADDLPPYLNILVTGHVVVGAALVIMAFEALSVWMVTGLAVSVAVAAALLLMRPLKGAVIGAQWALKTHGFGGDES